MKGLLEALLGGLSTCRTFEDRRDPEYSLFHGYTPWRLSNSHNTPQLKRSNCVICAYGQIVVAHPRLSRPPLNPPLLLAILPPVMELNSCISPAQIWQVWYVFWLLVKHKVLVIAGFSCKHYGKFCKSTLERSSFPAMYKKVCPY